MRNYKYIDLYLNKLLEDIYPQPQDPGHTKLAKEVIDRWMSRMTTCHSVLDAGAGEGFCQPFFENWGMKYEGVSLGEDVLIAQGQGYNVKKMDFSFLEYPNDSFDLVFSRHSFEHSPMPLLTLMEWARVARYWVGLIVPAPEYYTYKGLNHYSVMNMEQLEVISKRAGLKILWKEIRNLKTHTNDEEEDVETVTPLEYWLMLERENI